MSLSVVAIALAAPFTGAPAAPPVIVNSYRARYDSPRDTSEIITIESPEFARYRTLDSLAVLQVDRGGTTYFTSRQGEAGDSILRRTYAVQPDGALTSGYSRHERLASYVVAQARAGALTLTPTTLGSRAAWQVDVPLPPNECAGFPALTARVWLSQRTLLPLRVTERRASGAVFRTASYTYSLINARFPNATFAVPPVRPRPFVIDLRFTRTSPAAASGPLPYNPRVPSTLPPGFDLAVAGWAPRGSQVGAEGSIPPSAWLFAASYRRGQEHIDVTQRTSTKDWPDDPFGAECQPLTTEPVTINGVAATYGIGQNTPPHLYWRDGRLLYTLSGPFPKDDLVTIAASLKPLGS